MFGSLAAALVLAPQLAAREDQVAARTEIRTWLIPVWHLLAEVVPAAMPVVLALAAKV
jgi:hypothetical protein